MLDRAKELAREFETGAVVRDRERRFPNEQMRELRTSGLQALFVPREQGGSGALYSDAVRGVPILAEGDSNIAQMAFIHIHGVELYNLSMSPTNCGGLTLMRNSAVNLYSTIGSRSSPTVRTGWSTALSFIPQAVSLGTRPTLTVSVLKREKFYSPAFQWMPKGSPSSTIGLPWVSARPPMVLRNLIMFVFRRAAFHQPPSTIAVIQG